MKSTNPPTHKKRGRSDKPSDPSTYDHADLAPLVGHGQPLDVPSLNFQPPPPLFMEAQGQPLQIVTS